MTDRQRRWGLGIFTLVTLVLLGALIWLFGSLPALYKPSNRYTVTFEDAPGLKAGAPVRRSGVRVGEVDDIVLNDQDGTVEVKLRIDRTFTVRDSDEPTLFVNLLSNDA